MLQHASIRASAFSISLHTILQAAAGRAWARTRPPVRTCHTTHRASQALIGARPERKEGESSRVSLQSELEQHNNKAAVHIPTPISQKPTFPHNSPFSVKDTPKPQPYSTQDSVPLFSSCTEPATSASASARNPQSSRAATDALSRATIRGTNLVRTSSRYKELQLPWPETQVSPEHADVPAAYEGTLPRSRSRNTLYDTLAALRSSKNPPSLPELIRYHAASPSYQTSRTFNLLISVAIRNKNLETAAKLFENMLERGIDGDAETRRLRARLAIRRGEWIRAWIEESGQGSMPLSVWLEFFQGVVLPAHMSYRKDDAPSEQLSDVGPSAEQIERQIRLGRLRTLLRTLQQDIIPCSTGQTVHPYVVHSIVEAVLRMGGRAMAMDLTASYFQALPRRLKTSWQRWCLKIIHLHMLPGWKHGLAEHFCLRRTVHSYLGMHADLKPDATTLLLLMRPLKRTKQGGTYAWHLIRRFATRWGLTILSSEVLRRAASLATKEGRMDIVQAIMNRETLVSNPAKESEIRRRRGVGGWRWRLLRRRIWKYVRN